MSVPPCAPSLRSSLARHQPAVPAGDADLRAMRRMRAAWLKEGIAVIRPTDLADPWERQAVVNAATRLYGARRATSADSRDAGPQAQSEAQPEARPEDRHG